MRILVVVGKLGGGGAERVTATWVEGLAQRGHEVTVLTYVSPMAAATIPEVARTHSQLESKPQRWVGLPLAIRQQVRRDRPQVVLGVLDFSNIAILLALVTMPRAGRPAVVLTEHAVMSLLLRGYGAAGMARSAIARRLYRHADAAIAVSHAVATDLVATYRVPLDRVYVLPNPLTFPAFPHASSPRGTERSPSDTGVLLLSFVGRLVRVKRPGLVIDTAAELQARGFPCAVTIIGDGPEAAALLQQASRLGISVVFNGWLDDWRPVALASDCLLLPSVVEGFGVVLAEAAAMGLPCVAASSALGVADAIVPGVTGELALSSSPCDLADAVLTTQRASPTAVAPERWLDRFSVASAIERLETVLHRATAHATGNGVTVETDTIPARLVPSGEGHSE